jgi:hypothetical protein
MRCTRRNTRCDFCGTEGPALEITFSKNAERLPRDRSRSRTLCADCLAVARFAPAGGAGRHGPVRAHPHPMGPDWCHLCGERSDNTVDIHGPACYLRACRRCLDEAARLATGPAENSLDVRTCIK